MGSQSAASNHRFLLRPKTLTLAPAPPPPRPETLTLARAESLALADHHNPNPNPNSPSHSASSTSSFTAAVDDPSLVSAAVLSREEVIRRRARRLRRLERCYLDQYWALAEEVKSKHREYCWEHGVSPVEDEEEGEGVEKVERKERSKCLFAGCKTNAMALTRFCHTHILCDRDQTLYKACSYALKSGHTGPVTCGKPVLRATVPSLCSLHLQKAQKHISHALKRAGLSTSPTNRPAPKFHVIIAEYLSQIQAKRRGMRTAVNGGSKV